MAEITTFDNAYERYFSNRIDLLQQQMDNRLRMAVQEDTLKGAEALERHQVGAVNLVERTVRDSDTPIIKIPHRTRVCQGKAFEGADLIDPVDRNRFQESYEQSFVETWAAAAARRHDLNIIQAFFATAITGKNGSATAAFDTTNYGIVSSSVGMTVTKLRSAAQILRAAENMKDGGEYRWYICYKAKQLADLLGTTEATSSDFNTVKALVNGEINEFMGFTHLHSEQIEAVSSEDACAAWVKHSMLLGVAESGFSRIEQRADKSYATQVYYRIDSGATRLDEKGVVRILCA